MVLALVLGIVTQGGQESMGAWMAGASLHLVDDTDHIGGLRGNGPRY